MPSGSDVPVSCSVAIRAAAALVPLSATARTTLQRGKAASLWKEPKSTVTSKRGQAILAATSYAVGVLKDRV